MPTDLPVDPDWVDDDLLGPDYQTHTFALAPDDQGEVVATLVRRTAERPNGRAVLHVHGFADYFFQIETADYWVERGYDFYALDLRKYGRSLRPHQTPNYVGDLSSYYEELDLAWSSVAAEYHRIVVSAHSTGGLTVPLWIQDRGIRPAAVVLNSPWLDMHGPTMFRRVVFPAIGLVGARRPMREIPRKVSGIYARSLHREFRGEWDFDLTLKPLQSFSVYAGWMRAIRQGHQRVAAGIEVPAPILVLTSARSGHPSSVQDPEASTTDIVLDVEQIRRRAPLLGRHVTLAMIEGAVHDVTLSSPPVRARVFEEIDRFLGAYLDSPQPR